MSDSFVEILNASANRWSSWLVDCRRILTRMVDAERKMRVKPGLMSMASVLVLAAMLQPQLSPAGTTDEESKRASTEDADQETGNKNQEAETQSKRSASNNQIAFKFIVVGPDAKPVAGAKIEIRGSDRIQESQMETGSLVEQSTYGTSLLADDEGVLKLEFAKQPERLRISVQQPGYGPYWAGWTTSHSGDQLPASFTAELDRAWSVGGIICDDKGKPVSGAEVRPSIQYKKRPGDTKQLGTGKRILTDEEGRWSYHMVPVSKSDVFVEINHASFKPNRLSLSRDKFEIPLDSNEGHADISDLETPGVIVMDRGLVITGQVTDEKGDAIRGATIRTKLQNNVRTAKSGMDGNYELSGCEPGLAKIVAHADGMAVEMSELRISEKMEPVNFQLKPGNTIRIRVIDENSDPIPNARIFFQKWRGQNDYFSFDHVGQYADERGIWEWNEAPHDEIVADICRPGGMNLSGQSLIAREKEYVFSPPPQLIISGKVIDAKTEKPIEKFLVVPGLETDSGELQWITRESFESSGGEYRFTHFSQSYKNHPIRIEAEGYKSVVSRDINFDEGRITLDFKLEPGKSIEGIVLKPDGTPAENARVALGVDGSQISLENGDIDDGSTVHSFMKTTDATGRFEFPSRETPYQLVIVHTSGFAHLKLEPDSILEKIELKKWASIEGTFRVGRETVADVEISVGTDGIHSYGRNMPNIFTHHEVTTGRDGSFKFDRIVPGTGYITRGILLTVDDGSLVKTSSISMPIVLKPGELAKIDLGGTGSAVIGTLMPAGDFEGDPLWNFALIDIETVAEAGAVAGDVPEKRKPRFTATVGNDGTFRVDDMPAGDYRMTVRNHKADIGVIADYRFTVKAEEADDAKKAIDLGELLMAR